MSFMFPSCLVICCPSAKLLVIAIVLLSLVNLGVFFKNWTQGGRLAVLESVVDSIFFKINHFPVNWFRVRISSLFLFLVIEKSYYGIID